MKIAILVPNFVEHDGGARVAETQAQELVREGNHVAIFALAANMKVKDADLFIMGMPESLFWQRVYRLLFPLDLFKTIKWLRRLKGFDLVIAHFYPMTWLAYLARKIYRVKYTFWFHGIYDPWLFPHLYERVYTRLHILLTRMTVSNADRVVSVSKFSQAKLKEYTGRDSEVVYNKVDAARFHRGIDGSQIRKRHQLGDAPVILSVGRLAPQKGTHLLLEAFNMVRQEVPGARLVLAGDLAFDYYRPQLEQLSNNSVIFAGHVSKSEIPYYYAMCDVYATCSQWETFSLPVVEAQMCGKPVVAFDIAAFKETVDGSGALVEPGNLAQFARACVQKLKQVCTGVLAKQT